MAPDPASFRLPDRSTFLPSNINSYSFPASPAGPGRQRPSLSICKANAPWHLPPARRIPEPLRSAGVSLAHDGMRGGAPPRRPAGDRGHAQLGGQRLAVLTYTVGERAGIYRFADGRLSSIERGAEPPPPPATRRKPPGSRRPLPDGFAPSSPANRVKTRQRYGDARCLGSSTGTLAVWQSASSKGLAAAYCRFRTEPFAIAGRMPEPGAGSRSRRSSRPAHRGCCS